MNKTAVSKRKKEKSQLSIIVLCAIVLVMLLMIVNLLQSRSAIRECRQQLESIKMQCESQELENIALEDLMNNSDAEYIERKAREELDYVLPGERVYIVRSGD